MNRNRNKGILVTTVASVLSIVMFSTLFVGANRLALATAVNTTERIPAATVPVNAAEAENIQPVGYQRPSITVVEDESNASYYTKSANTLSVEDAADIGAQYIWDVFGENIDGMTVLMNYSSFPSSTRTYWHGTVLSGDQEEIERFMAPREVFSFDEADNIIEARGAAEGGAAVRVTVIEDLEDGEGRTRRVIVEDEAGEVISSREYNVEYDESVIEVSYYFEPGRSPVQFYFTIDAISGERISLYQEMYNRSEDVRNDPSITIEEMFALRRRVWMTSETESGGDPFAFPFESELLDGYAQIAREYAEKHFNSSDVISVDFNSSSPITYVRDSDTGEIIVKNYALYFDVTDDAGREASVGIVTGLNMMYFIDTQHNDIVPGFNYVEYATDVTSGLG